jgi:hypothetical protein
MKMIQVARTIDSTTVTIPELERFIGQTVEIIVQPVAPKPPKGDPRRWDALLDLMNDPGDYDFDAAAALRDRDRETAKKEAGLE